MSPAPCPTPGRWAIPHDLTYKKVNHRRSSVGTVPVRPYTIMSCAVSPDGCLDDPSPEPLILSGPEDLDEVDELRSAADAILVGAGTIRADNPRLLVRDDSRLAVRE